MNKRCETTLLTLQSLDERLRKGVQRIRQLREDSHRGESDGRGEILLRDEGVVLPVRLVRLV